MALSPLERPWSFIRAGRVASCLPAQGLSDSRCLRHFWDCGDGEWRRSEGPFCKDTLQGLTHSCFFADALPFAILGPFHRVPQEAPPLVFQLSSMPWPAPKLHSHSLTPVLHCWTVSCLPCDSEGCWLDGGTNRMGAYSGQAVLENTCTKQPSKLHISLQIRMLFSSADITSMSVMIWALLSLLSAASSVIKYPFAKLLSPDFGTQLLLSLLLSLSPLFPCFF